MSAPTGRKPRRRGLAGRWLLALSCLVLTVLGATPALAARPAQNGASTLASAVDPLTVRVTGAQVTAPDAAARVVVTGSVTNAGASPAFDVRVRIWRSTAPLRSPDAVDRALAATATTPGQPLTSATEHTFAVTAPADALAPGASASFTVSASLDELGFAADTSYWVGADATAASVPAGSWDLHGHGRTITSVPGRTAPRIATLVVLDDAPHRVRPDLFADDTLATDLAEGGRLRQLLDAAAAPGRGWIVDPALVVAATDMEDGYRVVDGTGSRPGTGAAAAREWLAAFRALPAGSGFQTVFGRPDLAGGRTEDAATLLRWGLAATTAAGLDLPTVALSTRLDAAALAALGARSVPAVQPGAHPAEPWWTTGAVGVASALDLDSPLDSPVLGDDTPARAAAALARARAAGQQVRLVRSPAALALDDAATPAWAMRGPLGDVLASPPVRVAPPAVSPAASGDLNPELRGRLVRLHDDLATYGSASPQTGLGPAADGLAASIASEHWLADPAARARFAGLVTERSGVDRLAGGVTLSAAGTVTLGADNSQFPATVTNGLPDPITVRVVAVSENSARLRVEPSEWVTIRPGDRFSAVLTAHPAASGVIDVDLRVETGDGLAVSEPVRVSVEATNLGTISWIIVGVSGLVLVGSTAARIRQMRRRRGATA